MFKTPIATHAIAMLLGGAAGFAATLVIINPAGIEERAAETGRRIATDAYLQALCSTRHDTYGCAGYVRVTTGSNDRSGTLYKIYSGRLFRHRYAEVMAPATLPDYCTRYTSRAYWPHQTAYDLPVATCTFIWRGEPGYPLADQQY